MQSLKQFIDRNLDLKYIKYYPTRNLVYTHTCIFINMNYLSLPITKMSHAFKLFKFTNNQKKHTYTLVCFVCVLYTVNTVLFTDATNAP